MENSRKGTESIIEDHQQKIKDYKRNLEETLIDLQKAIYTNFRASIENHNLFESDMKPSISKSIKHPPLIERHTDLNIKIS